MLTVFKYDVPIYDAFSLSLPKGAKILSFQAQHDRPVIWALINPDAPKEQREFRLAGTGHPIHDQPDALNFIGTCQYVHVMGGSRIWHLFELVYTP